MAILDNLYKHSMIHPDVADAYIDGKSVSETILQNEFPNPEFLEAMGTIGTKYADISLVQTEHGTISADSTHIELPGKVTLTAVPGEGYEISKWQVSTDGSTWTDVADATENTLEYNLTNPGTYSFKAIFIQSEVEVIVEISGSIENYNQFSLDGDQFTESQKSVSAIPGSKVTLSAPEQIEWVDGGPGIYLNRVVDEEGLIGLSIFSSNDSSIVFEVLSGEPECRATVSYQVV